MYLNPAIISERATYETAQKTHVFKKEAGKWYIHLPQYLEQGWSKNDLQMEEGAHQLLSAVSSGRQRVTLKFSTRPFEGANELELMEHCAAPKGGAVYLMETCQGRATSSFVWFYDIALFVFGNFPDYIYVQRISK